VGEEESFSGKKGEYTLINQVKKRQIEEGSKGIVDFRQTVDECSTSSVRRKREKRKKQGGEEGFSSYIEVTKE